MNLEELPWLELSIGASLLGALIVSQMRNPNRAYRWGLAFSAGALTCSVLAWLSFYLGAPQAVVEGWSVQPRLFGRVLLRLDELSAPLVPAVALLHFLTALA